MAVESLNVKVCRKCGSSFCGRACLVCMRAHANAAYAKNPVVFKARKAAYRKANPEKIKAQRIAWEQANPDKIAAYRVKNAVWQARNYKRVLANVAAYQSANKEKCYAAIATWSREHPEARRLYSQNRSAKKRASGGKLSTGLVEKLFKLQNGKCPCCGLSLGKDAHLDHVMPIARGGVNEDWNMQLLRAKCNLEKNAKHPVDFMQQRGFLI